MFRSEVDRSNETEKRRLIYSAAMSRDIWSFPSQVVAAHVPLATYLELPEEKTANNFAKRSDLSKERDMVNENLQPVKKTAQELDQRIALLRHKLELLN